VALIDRGDFGGATSFNNLKTLHGGLRSLQSLNLRQMRLFIRERRALARVAPHLVGPMGFLAPTYRHPVRSASALRTALAINDLVARDRHDALPDVALHLPNGRLVSRDECVRLNPVIDPDGVTGGALWYDYQMHNADRMTLSFALSAAARGARIANYVSATGVLRDGGRIAGISARDQRSSDTFDIRARAVLNATGPWAASWLAALDPPLAAPAASLSRAMNVVTRRVAVPQGCAGLTGGRFLFLVPWRDVTVIGTSHEPHDGAADDLAVSSRDVERFMADAARAFPRAKLTVEDVTLVHRGLLPSTDHRRDHVTLLRESRVVDHRRVGASGLISMFGVRYTTARHTAARAVDAVFDALGQVPPPCTTATTPVDGGDIEDKSAVVRRVLHDGGGFPQSALHRIALTYGTNAERVVRLAHERPELARPLGTHCGVTAAEILHAARHEAAVTLSDAVMRRTEAGSAGHPGDEALAGAAAVMASELGWSAAHAADELAGLSAAYRLPG
jgi:glycerol-3-phosphate dehydrogenase